MRTLGVLFYTAALVTIGALIIIFAVAFSFPSLQPQCIQYLNDMLLYIQDSISARLIIGLSGFLLILISFIFNQLILDRFQREKNIAFPTSSGQVTIALTAIEDLIKRLAYMLPNVKELRPDVRAHKKGITVDLKVVLKSEANIAALTEQLEDLTKTRMQEVLGLEEKITINTHIIKIISQEDKDKRRKESDFNEPTVPFSGYGRV